MPTTNTAHVHTPPSSEQHVCRLCRIVTSVDCFFLKVAKGNATFSTSKCILGWDLDTHHMTIHLPQHRLQTLLQQTMKHQHTTWSKWRRLLGELRSTVPAIHSAKYLFSVLQHVL
jgi:hypothetical protein